MQTARQVDRQHGRAGRVDLSTIAQTRLVERSVESGAKQRIGDDIVTLEHSRDRTAGPAPRWYSFLPCASRITAQALGRTMLATLTLRPARWASAAPERSRRRRCFRGRTRPGSRCASGQRARRERSAAWPARVISVNPGIPQRVDRVAVDCAHLSGGVKSGRKTGHGDDYTDAAKRLRVSGTASQP